MKNQDVVKADLLKECEEAGLELKRDGEPKAPKSVREPSKPAKPLDFVLEQTNLHSNSWTGDGTDSVSLKDILSKSKEYNIDPNNIIISVSSEEDSDYYGGSNYTEVKFDIYCEKEVENPNYKKQLEKYNHKMEVYKLKLADYKKTKVEQELVEQMVDDIHERHAEYLKKLKVYNKYIKMIKTSNLDKQIQKLQKEREKLLSSIES